MEHPDSLEVLSKKDELSKERDKATIRLAIRAHEKLEKDVIRTMNTCQRHHIMMERLVKAHGLVSIRAQGEVRPEHDIEREIQTILA